MEMEMLEKHETRLLLARPPLGQAGPGRQEPRRPPGPAAANPTTNHPNPHPQGPQAPQIAPNPARRLPLATWA